MSKELEAFDRVINVFPFLEINETTNYTLEDLSNDTNLIREGLQRLEAIEKGKNTDITDNYMAFKNNNANPSEAMECLEVINNYGCGINDNMKFSEVFEKEYDTIKQALLKAQELENRINIETESKQKIIKDMFALKKENDRYKKCLSIIKEKDVDIEFLKSADTFEEYNKLIKFKTPFAIALTEEEFDLLKSYFTKNIQK